MRTTNGQLIYVMITIMSLALAIATAAPAQGIIPLGVVVDDGVPF